MSILANQNTRLIVQGITGTHGRFHTRQMLDYGTRVVGGVTPGKGGEIVEGVPVFDTVRKAVRATGADASVIYVPALFARDAIMEAVEAGIRLVVVITEGIPPLDMAKVRLFLGAFPDVHLIGPNCPGIITPGETKIGIMPGYIHRPGGIGVLSRSGTLTYEAVWQITQLGLGQSTCIGIGGDPVTGMNFVDCLKLFNDDPQTEAVVLIGEIGGSSEEEAGKYIEESFTKPVAAFVAGMTAPPGRRMGHAGAIILAGTGRAVDKIERLARAGVRVAASPAEIGLAVKACLGAKRHG